MALNWSSKWQSLNSLFHQSRELTRELAREWAWRLEGRNAWIGRRLLKVALTATSSIGTTVGLELEEINDSKVVLRLNRGWPDLTAGEVSSAAMLNAAEAAARFFWERQLSIGLNKLRMSEAKLKVVDILNGPATILYAVSPNDREAWMSQLRSAGDIQCDTTAQIFDTNSKLVATCEMSWRFSRQLQLESRS